MDKPHPLLERTDLGINCAAYSYTYRRDFAVHGQIFCNYLCVPYDMKLCTNDMLDKLMYCSISFRISEGTFFKYYVSHSNPSSE